MPEASSPSFIYQHNGTQDDFSNSDRLSTAMIYKAIGMLSSLETIVHHLGAGSAASASARYFESCRTFAFQPNTNSMLRYFQTKGR